LPVWLFKALSDKVQKVTAKFKELLREEAEADEEVEERISRVKQELQREEDRTSLLGAISNDHIGAMSKSLLERNPRIRQIFSLHLTSTMVGQFVRGK
jgi:hypothetical protein